MLTTNTRRQLPFLRDAEFVNEGRDELFRQAKQHQFRIVAYCFMPDHLHLPVQGSERSGLLPFIQRFKQVTGYCCKLRYGQPLWQRSFYDHVLRSKEDVRQAAEYISDNPGRAGLGAVRKEYPRSDPQGQI